MREVLYIRLHSGAPDAVTAYCTASPDAALSFAVQHAPLTDVLAQAEGRRIVVLVPGADVRLTAVTVPAKQPAKVLQAAPYVLEEQLAEDVDTLHFALGPRQSDGSHPVAVVARARMDEWLAPFHERGLRPEALLPETLCLPPVQPEQWSALAEADHVTVRTGAHAGFGCVSDDLPLFLELADPERRSLLRLIVPRGIDRDFTRLQWPLELLPGFGEPLAALLPHVRPDGGINLLQGAYSQREDFKRLWLPWRAAAVLAAVWLALAMVLNGVQAFRYGHQAAAQDKQNVQRFEELFPTQTRIVDLQAQAEQQMRALQGSSSSNGFLLLLETLAAALSATPGLSLRELQFHDGAVFAGLTGSDLQQLETLRGWFANNHNARLEVQSANAGTDGAQIRLKLTAP